MERAKCEVYVPPLRNKPSTHEWHVSMNGAQNLNLGLLRLTLTLEPSPRPPKKMLPNFETAGKFQS